MEKVLTGWQEGARKDIERAFGHLQARFQFLARPINLHRLTDISNRVSTCVILHNMCVSDRVMDGDVNARYNPAFDLLDARGAAEVVLPSDLAEVQGTVEENASNTASIGLSNLGPDVQQLILRKKEWLELQDLFQHARLHTALMTHHCSNRNRKRKRNRQNKTP